MTSCNAVSWQFLRPTADINHIHNPSIEFDTSGYTAGLVSAITRDTAERWSGCASLKVTYTGGAGNPVVTNNTVRNLSVTPGATYYFKARLKGVAGETYLIVIYDPSPTIVGSATFIASGGWDECAAAFVPLTAQPFYAVSGQNAGFSAPFFVDGLEVVSVANATYIDGDQIDCIWRGIPHASPSSRLGNRRGGGIPIDLQTNYGLQLGSETGTGMHSPDYNEQTRTYYPGTQTTGFKTTRRVWQIGGIIQQSDFNSLRRARNELISEIAPLTVTRLGNAPQPVRWRRVGAYKTLQIDGHYEAGLDVGISANDLNSELVALRVLSNDNPFWYAVPQEGAELDYNDEPTYTNAFTFSRKNGTWDVLNTTSAGNRLCLAVAVNGDGNVYFGGDWTSLEGDATLQYLARYNPLAQAWESVAAGAVNGIVRALLPLPDGRIMVGGDFTNVGDANGDYAVIYDPATDTYASLNTHPLNDVVRGLALDPTTGDVLLVGDFTQDSAPTTLNYIARWTGGTADFTANGTAIDNDLFGVGVRRNGQIIVTGTHTEKISACDPGTTTWYQVANDTGANNDGRFVFVDPDDDTVFVLGTWTQFDTETCNAILQLGTVSAAYVQWNTVGSGMTGGAARGIAKHPDGSYRIVGAWTAVGDVTTDSKILRWNGSVLTLELCRVQSSTLGGIYAVAISPDGDEWYGMSDLPAGAQVAGLTTISMPDGAAPTWPVFSIRKIGATGTARLWGCENFSRENQRIIFDSPLMLADETITINCGTGVISSTAGRALDTRGGTTPMQLTLAAGDNRLFFLIATTGGATVVARAYWHTAYWSVDAADDHD